MIDYSSLNLCSTCSGQDDKTGAVCRPLLSFSLHGSSWLPLVSSARRLFLYKCRLYLLAFSSGISSSFPKTSLSASTQG